MSSTTSPRIQLSAPHLGGQELSNIQNAIAENMIAVGSYITAFELAVAKKVGVPHAVALASGTAALHLALLGLGVKRGDSVWCSSLTFCGSANPISYVGAQPVFIDCDIHTWNLDPALLAQGLDDAAKKGSLPKAVICVDLYGQCAHYDAIIAACSRYEVPLIEDAAEALGAHYHGRAAGSFGRASILSFNGNKIITTGGGGMLLSHDANFIAQARHLSSQARDPAAWYEHTKIGYNYRLSNINSALGCGQMVVLEDRVLARRRVYSRYQKQLGNIPGISFAPDLDAETGTRCTRWLTVILLDPAIIRIAPLALMQRLEDLSIDSRPVWKPMHLQPIFSGCRVLGGSVSESLFIRGLCLPSSSSLTDDEQDRVIAAIRTAVTR